MKGLKRQLEEMWVMSPTGVGCVCQCDDDPEEWAGTWWREGSPHEDTDNATYTDDLAGRKLDPRKVRGARKVELALIDSKTHLRRGGRGGVLGAHGEGAAKHEVGGREQGRR